MANLPSGEQKRSLQEAFAGKNAEMKAVAQAAFSLAKSYPDKFEVDVIKGENRIDFSARSNFEFDDAKFNIQISLDHRVGRSTQEILINEEGKAHLDPDAISYRLDISFGEEVDREYKETASRAVGFRGSDKETQELKEHLSALLSAIYGGNPEEGTTSYIDNYAETTITTKSALELLQNASKFNLPNSFGLRLKPTLKDFYEWVKSNQDRQAKAVRGLLS